MASRNDRLEIVGLRKRLSDQGINPVEFIGYVDRGAKPARLLQIYDDKIKNWRTMTKYLDQLAHERGLKDRHSLYI